MAEFRRLFRRYPQAFVLLAICIVLGLGTFMIVMFGIASAGSDKTTGYPNGSAHLHQTVAGGARSAARPA